jgi:hypothetical protein
MGRTIISWIKNENSNFSLGLRILMKNSKIKYYKIIYDFFIIF